MTGYYGYELNWLGIILAALAPTVLGFLWYHPKAFGKVWMESVKLSEDDLKQNQKKMPVMMVVSLVMSLTLAYYFAMRYHGVHEGSNVFSHAAYHGFMTYGYVAMPVLVMNLMYEGRNLKGVLVNVAYWALAMIAICLVVNLLPGAKVPAEEGLLLQP